VTRRTIEEVARDDERARLEYALGSAIVRVDRARQQIVRCAGELIAVLDLKGETDQAVIRLRRGLGVLAHALTDRSRAAAALRRSGRRR
jgi:hypothetical protein